MVFLFPLFVFGRGQCVKSRHRFHSHTHTHTHCHGSRVFLSLCWCMCVHVSVCHVHERERVGEETVCQQSVLRVFVWTRSRWVVYLLTWCRLSLIHRERQLQGTMSSFNISLYFHLESIAANSGKRFLVFVCLLITCVFWCCGDPPLLWLSIETV